MTLTIQMRLEEHNRMMHEIAALKFLVARAADALEGYAGQSGEYDKEAFNLVAELRKAAE